MTADVRIVVGGAELPARLDDSPTAAAIAKALPLEGTANRWGEEIYFSIPVKAEEEPGAREVMAVGEIAYWPPGNAFCIFFGRTPASTDARPRAASAVNPIGRIQGDATAFRAVPSGARVRLERV